MKSLNKILSIIVIFFITGIICSAQPFTKKYIMSFHICDVDCMGFPDHMVQLAESDDGMNWTLVPNFVSYNGSVPDVIIRGNKLYIYTPGKVKRYDNSTNTWDSEPVPVVVMDKDNQPVMFVDPSAFIDENGRIVLFYLNSTGSTTDPASCPTYPCTKVFGSAVEVEGSDGTDFIAQDGNRATIELTENPSFASDPDIFYDGNNYILYISRGQETIALKSSTLHGTYSSFGTLPNDILTNQGGVPSGIYDEESQQYWTYVHANEGGRTVIKRAVHSNFASQLNSFSTVISGPIIGEPSTTSTESPGIAVNTFLATNVQSVNNNFPANFSLAQNYPNPFNPSTNINFTIPQTSKVILKVFDVLGREVVQLVNRELSPGSYNFTFDAANLPGGVYFYRITVGNTSANSAQSFVDVKKMILLK